MDVTPFAIFLSVALGGGVAALVLNAIGGVGVDRALNKRLATVEDELDTLTARLSKEIKRRAGEAGRSAIEEKRTLEQEAAERLASQPADYSQARPRNFKLRKH